MINMASGDSGKMVLETELTAEQKSALQIALNKHSANGTFVNLEAGKRWSVKRLKAYKPLPGEGLAKRALHKHANAADIHLYSSYNPIDHINGDIRFPLGYLDNEDGCFYTSLGGCDPYAQLQINPNNGQMKVHYFTDKRVSDQGRKNFAAGVAGFAQDAYREKMGIDSTGPEAAALVALGILPTDKRTSPGSKQKPENTFDIARVNIDVSGSDALNLAMYKALFERHKNGLSKGDLIKVTGFEPSDAQLTSIGMTPKDVQDWKGQVKAVETAESAQTARVAKEAEDAKMEPLLKEMREGNRLSRELLKVISGVVPPKPQPGTPPNNQNPQPTVQKKSFPKLPIA